MADIIKIFASHGVKGFADGTVVYGSIWSIEAVSVERVTVELPEGFKRLWDQYGFPLIEGPDGVIESASSVIRCAMAPDSPPIIGWYFENGFPWKGRRKEYDLKVVAREPFPAHGTD